MGRKQCTCKHCCHINGFIKSFIDQEDEHINVVADDTGRPYIRVSLVVIQSAVRQRENNICVNNDQVVRHCDDVDNGLDNTCEVIRQETVIFSTPETDYIIYD